MNADVLAASRSQSGGGSHQQLNMGTICQIDGWRQHHNPIGFGGRCAAHEPHFGSDATGERAEKLELNALCHEQNRLSEAFSASPPREQTPVKGGALGAGALAPFTLDQAVP